MTCLFSLILAFVISIEAQDDLKLSELKAYSYTSESKTEQAGIEIIEKITAYVKNYGKSVAQYIEETRNIKMLNRVETSSKHTIMDGDHIISIDLIKKTGIISKNISKDFLGNMTNKDANQFGKEMMDIMNAQTKKLGTKQIIADVTCEDYLTTSDMMGIKSETLECKYKGINFLEKSNAMGVIRTMKFMSFIEGDSGPESAWKPEPGVKLKEVNW